MSLNIDKKEMDLAWHDRKNNNKFYEYIYELAKHQVSRKGIPHKEFADYVQFAVFKCFKHVDSFKPSKGAAYSFFWKQISLSIIYKQRKEARRNNKIKTFYVDQEKILDWAEKQYNYEEEGHNFSDIVDQEEALKLKKAFKKYNSLHRDSKLEPSKQSAIKVLEWMEEREPGFIDSFTTLKNIFKSWVNK